MAQYYKLIDAASSAETFHLAHKNSKGILEWHFYQLQPGVKYSEHADDEYFVQGLKEDAHRLMDYTDARKAALDACGARYEETKTRCCGGRRKLKVWLVEVVE